MRSGCISHPASSRLAILRAEYLAACNGSYVGALLLNNFEFWHDIRLKQIEQERLRAATDDEYRPNLDTWIYKSLQDLGADLLDLYKRDKILEGVALIEKLGFVETRSNPRNAYDRTKQFRFLPEPVQQIINEFTETEPQLRTSRKPDPRLSRNRPSTVDKSTLQGRKTDSLLTENTLSKNTENQRTLSGSSSSTREREKNKRFSGSKKPDDDAKPKLGGQEYASARDELKAIHHAKTGEYPTTQFLDRLEGFLSLQAKTFDDYLDVLRPHLGNTWKNPGGFLTHLAKTGFAGQASPPQAKPKPKCPTCMADNQRGAILQDGAIVPCPDCSTPEWRRELASKTKRS